LYAVLKGTVASVQSFGVFVRFEGKKRQGLVHVSQLSNYRVENPREMLAEGDSVWVKVVGVSDEDGKKKISLSMKLVNQTTGQDLDANNGTLRCISGKAVHFLFV
jgi:polyribonucleotide nucleotidyltransferase